MADILAMISISIPAVVTLFFAIWVLHLFLRNAGIVDVGWGLGFILITLIYMLKTEAWEWRHFLVLAMITFWGLRIALFLIKRIIFEGYEDRRYNTLRLRWQKEGSNVSMRFLVFFEIQALLQIIISIPIVFICLNKTSGVSAFEIVGFGIWMLSLYGETISDRQLQTFKENPVNKGKVCQEGLWYYSRHPNYFFEVLCWFGLFIFALGSPYGWVGIIAPAVMLYLIICVTGIPLTEQLSVEHRGEAYKKYQAATSPLIPWPRRNV